MDALLTELTGSSAFSPFLNSMDDDGDSGAATPVLEGDDVEEASYDKQLQSLRTYLDALPYPCETPEQMHAALERIVGRIAVCARTKNWLVQGTWDGLLQW
jgi:proteasome activator subunit 4